MKYNQLGRTELKVSRICLGTMTWGEQNTEAEAHQQLDVALGAGINFIDSAEMYPVPPRAETYGRTEQYIGSWLKARNNRDQVIIASKVMSRSTDLNYVRDGDNRLDKKNILAAVEGSLSRLQTDYIDLYQLHWPDRRCNFFGQLGYVHDNDDEAIEIAETLEVLSALVSSGKVRHIGLSNETPWGTMEFLRLSQQLNLPRAASIQNPYSLLNRSFEVGLAEIAHRENIGLLAYSPLGFGTLSGKYLNNRNPKAARLTLFDRFQRYTNIPTQHAIAEYVTLAQQHKLDPAQMALAYVNSRSFLTSTIIGATTLEQLHSNINSIDLVLNNDVIEGIEAIHRRHPNPSP